MLVGHDMVRSHWMLPSAYSEWQTLRQGQLTQTWSWTWSERGTKRLLFTVSGWYWDAIITGSIWFITSFRRSGSGALWRRTFWHVFVAEFWPTYCSKNLEWRGKNFFWIGKEIVNIVKNCGCSYFFWFSGLIGCWHSPTNFKIKNKRRSSLEIVLEGELPIYIYIYIFGKLYVFNNSVIYINNIIDKLQYILEQQ